MKAIFIWVPDLGVLRKTNVKSEITNRILDASQSCNMLTTVRMQMPNFGAAIDVFTRSVSIIPIGKTLDKTC